MSDLPGHNVRLFGSFWHRDEARLAFKKHLGSEQVGRSGVESVEGAGDVACSGQGFKRAVNLAFADAGGSCEFRIVPTYDIDALLADLAGERSEYAHIGGSKLLICEDFVGKGDERRRARSHL